MKTTLDINDALLSQAKALAARRHSTLTRLIEEGLQLRLQAGEPGHASRQPRKTPLPVYRGKGGLVAGIDPTSNKSMLDAAEDVAS